MNAAVVEALLAETRLGILTTLRPSGLPVSVPVWFEWDGERARCFSSVTSAKIGRLKRDARASLLVLRTAGEPEGWVALEGEVSIRADGALALAERLAQRYWDLADTDHRATVERWRRQPKHLRLLELTPTEIRSYQG